MKPRSLVLVLAGLIGAPIWLLADARQTLGSNIFNALVALSIVGCLTSLAVWAFEREDAER